MNDMFIIDSNSFILPYQQMYSFDCFPSFWSWLEQEINKAGSKIIVTRCVYKELSIKNDQLSSWVVNNLKNNVFDERKDQNVWINYSKVMDYITNSGYYGSTAINNWSKKGKADPLLIAIAMTMNCKIITFEQYSGAFQEIVNDDGSFSNRPKDPKYKTKKEPKILDIAQHFGVTCLDLYYLERELGLLI